jgi:periplasmic protein TonB
MLLPGRAAMFEDFMPPPGVRRPFGPRPGLLTLSVLLHLTAVGALLATAALAPGGRGEQPIEVLLLHAAMAGGVEARSTPALSPAARQAERERQAMLDRLVQPASVPAAAPEASSGAPAPAPAAKPDAAGADLPVEAGGGIRRPQVIEASRVLPVYPEEAQRAGLEGLVVLKVEIDEQGRVGRIEVLRSLGHGFDEAAVTAVRQWRFRPATRYGKPIKVFHVIPFDFRL